MASKLGPYWSVMHRRPADYDFFRRLQPSVIKVMDPGDNDIAWINENLPNALVVARIHALSEQHDDMLKDPVGTGIRHANEWNEHANRLGLDRSRTLVLGQNEPRVWDPGVPEALRLYTIALCDKATELGLRVGAMQLSVGWPGNDGPNTPPNWTLWHDVDNAIRRNRGALVLHEYWADNGPGENWGWWAGRSLKCPWQVPIVIGECGIDIYVKDSSVAHANRGWRGHVDAARYARELADYVGRMSADARFVGCCVFAADYANGEWASFDIEPAYQAILATPIPDVKPTTIHIPGVSTGAPPPTKVPALAHPIQNPALRIISQRFAENPQDYIRFGMAGHTGIDFAVPEGTPVVAVDDGQVVEVLEDIEGYGKYIKLRHTWGESLYAHLSHQHLLGGNVRKGGLIGRSGSTGNATGPHLHFALRVNPYKRGAPYDGFSDPLPYLQKTVAPAPSNDFAAIEMPLREAAHEFSLDWQLLASLVYAESRFDRTAVSDKGALGLCQIMPLTWAEWAQKVGASDPFDAKDNLRVGAAYLRWCLSQVDNNRARALVAYNFGLGNVLSGREAPLETRIYAYGVVHGCDLLKEVAG
jgi:hypothetical protein